MKEAPNFHTWSYQNLANFATDAYARMVEQSEEIQQLRLKILELESHRVQTPRETD